ncbi:sulfatase [Dyadobacter sp. CY261]|uniref:sulfatase family protein n=1 Tax=Dyadobacter sp. CY261 TaxID=2907203 RepID=UPI001F34BB92|nr:sulfatase [Dyadobacter sp. CY261]MCF0074085.1 sulfatase [Dyadobacter sp. CY261]
MKSLLINLLLLTAATAFAQQPQPTTQQTAARPIAARPIAARPTAARPNIILIYTDDQRFDALSVVQQEQGDKARFPWFTTPNLDRLANEGVRFRNAFVINSLCSPSRSTMLNGRYNHLNGIANNHTGLSDTTVTYATELRKAGYTTAFFGKWHMGKETGKRPGFDYSASFVGQGQYFDCPIEVNGKTEPSHGWVDDVSTTNAIEYIKQHKNETLLVTLAFKSGHGPFQPPVRHKDTFAQVKLTKPVTESLTSPYKNQIETPRRQNGGASGNANGAQNANAAPNGSTSASWTENNDQKIRNYFGALKGVDENVGRILSVLDSLKLDQNTVVIFSSDNGFFFGEHGLGDKRAAYEESIRIPLLVRYPARFPKGKKIDQMVLNLDNAPTLLDLAGVPAPASFQGKSWVPLIEDKAKGWRTSFLYEYFYETPYNTPTIKAVRTETGKLIQYPGEEGWSELYDLSKDPAETTNLYQSPNGEKLKKQLLGELSKQEKATGYINPDYADARPVDEKGQYKRPVKEVIP